MTVHSAVSSSCLAQEEWNYARVVITSGEKSNHLFVHSPRQKQQQQQQTAAIPRDTVAVTNTCCRFCGLKGCADVIWSVLLKYVILREA